MKGLPFGERTHGFTPPCKNKTDPLSPFPNMRRSSMKKLACTCPPDKDCTCGYEVHEDNKKIVAGNQRVSFEDLKSLIRQDMHQTFGGPLYSSFHGLGHLRPAPLEDERYVFETVQKTKTRERPPSTLRRLVRAGPSPDQTFGGPLYSSFPLRPAPSEERKPRERRIARSPERHPISTPLSLTSSPHGAASLGGYAKRRASMRNS